MACNASAGQSTTFEVLRFEGEQDEPEIQSLTIVHPDQNVTDSLSNPASAANEWFQIAAATVIGIVLHQATGARIQRICRTENGLGFHMETREGDEDCFLSVVSAKDDARAALGRAIEIARATPCIHKIAAAVAFGSGKAALRVLS